MIRFTKVTKKYPRARRRPLSNVTFRVAKGEFVFLTGPSGAGKSTILKLIYMEERPTSGEVRVSGYELDHHPTRVTSRSCAAGSASSSRTSGCSRIGPRRQTSRSRSR